jgi:hypothetical protein
LCRQIEIASSCHGKDGVGEHDLERREVGGDVVEAHRVRVLQAQPASPGTPVPMPLCPEWKSAGTPASAIASYSG